MTITEDPISQPTIDNPIIDRPNYFVNLPRDFYLSEERFTKELEVIYGRQWIYVAHVSEIPTQGDYVTSNLPGGESVIVVRAAEGRINAFFNVCRHRGFSLCDPGTGHAKAFVCPYHRWSYGTDGALRGAPSMPKGKFFDYADFGLKPVHMEVWHGFVFVNLSEDLPQPLGPGLDRVSPDMARLEGEHMKVAYHRVYEMETNWKFLMENWMECTHCGAVHSSTLCTQMDLTAMFSDIIDAIEPEEYGPMWIPLKESAKTVSYDGDFITPKLLGEFGRGADPTGFSTGFFVQPAISGALFQSDYGVMHRVDPVTPTKTLLHNWWFVREDAVEGVDYDLEELLEVWDQTNTEDSFIVERQQIGAQSRGFTPGPHSNTRESSMRACLLIYLRMMGDTGHAAG
jgi:phenylpropionate dioxygenase-like ring-hydroxylating dioxygenase large terminal subunit